jgi:predicted RNA-binding Zn-ribbon protein involved in translation (DUF1610 family)
MVLYHLYVYTSRIAHQLIKGEARHMFICPICGEWVLETALSRLLGVEVAKLQHRVAKHDPVLAQVVGIIGAILVMAAVSWAGPKLYRAFTS